MKAKDAKAARVAAALEKAKAPADPKIARVAAKALRDAPIVIYSDGTVKITDLAGAMGAIVSMFTGKSGQKGAI